MDHPQRQNRIPSGAQQPVVAEPSVSALNGRRAAPVLAPQGGTGPMSVTPESLGQVINKSPHLYSSYDRRTRYKALTPEHRQLRDFLHLSGLMQTAADDINANLWMRFADQNGQLDRNPSNLVPEIIVTSNGVYCLPNSNPQIEEEHFLAPPGPGLAYGANAVDGIDFSDLTNLPLHEWPLFDDPSVVLGDFAGMQTIEMTPNLAYQDPNGLIQLYQQQQPPGAQPSTSGDPGSSRGQGWEDAASASHPPQPSLWSSQPHSR